MKGSPHGQGGCSQASGLCAKVHSNIYHMMKTGKHIERRKGGVFVYTPVNDVERVQISQRAGHLSNVEFCPRLWESPLFLEVEEELIKKGAYPKGGEDIDPD